MQPARKGRNMPSANRKVLGRGLSALIPVAGSDDALDRDRTEAPKRDYFRVAIEEVHPTADQPRRLFDEAALGELVESIRQDGLLQPLLVRQRTAAEGPGYA